MPASPTPTPNADARLLIGGGLAYQLTSATTEMPFDIVLAGGLGLTTGDDVTTVRVPFGAAIGHRFPLEGDIAITPFVHPAPELGSRLVQRQLRTATPTSNVDIGANFEFKPQMALRVAAALGDDDAIALCRSRGRRRGCGSK
jgi:hypothetical protein